MLPELPVSVLRKRHLGKREAREGVRGGVSLQVQHDGSRGQIQIERCALGRSAKAILRLTVHEFLFEQPSSVDEEPASAQRQRDVLECGQVGGRGKMAGDKQIIGRLR